MEEPDYDDMINDYVENYEAPAEYDDDMLEEMMGEQATTTNSPSLAAAPPSQQQVQTDAGVTTTTTTTIPTRTTHTQELNNNNAEPMEEIEEDDEEGVNVRDYRSRQNDDSHLYNFKSYKKCADWRRTSLVSSESNTSYAKGWKSNQAELLKGSSLYNKPRQASAPEAQLLEFLQQRSAPLPKMKLRKTLLAPREGQSTLPMTLADGTRVYVRTRCLEAATSNSNSADSSSLPTSSSSAAINPLGVSMKELRRRSEIIRRKKPSISMQRGGIVGKGQLWVDKHAPSSFPHLLSDERTNREVLRALRAWDPYVFSREPPARPIHQQQHHNQHQESSQPQEEPTPVNPNDKRPDEHNRVILLSGPPGVGKTTLAHIIARHAGYRPMEVNASDERSTSVLTDRVRRAMESTTINFQSDDDSDYGRPNCLILDEIDGADAKGAVQSLVEIIRADIPPKKGKKKAPYLRRPIIFICNHKYAPALRPLLPFARHFTVDPPSPTRLVARLKAVLSREKLSMMTGGSLLHQLVVSSGGDIRSCLFTLQFASTQAKDSNDLAQALTVSLGGSGLKDNRNDIASTITTVFRRVKKRIGGFATGEDRASVTRVLAAVEGLGDNSATINSLFLNVLRVSYIDPTLDRCSAAHEWLSGADLFRSNKLSPNNQMAQYSMQRLHTPSVAAAIHMLCRVELKPDLSFSNRELTDSHYQRAANLGLVQKFSEALPPMAKAIKCQNLLSTEFIPLALWILSAGEGNSAICRAASSVDVLSKVERVAVDCHVAALRTLGLTYVADFETLANNADDKSDNQFQPDPTVRKMRLEPPIDRLVQYAHFKAPVWRQRKEIPKAMKELIAQQVRLEGFRKQGGKKGSRAEKIKSPSSERVSSKPAHITPEVTPRKLEDLAKAVHVPPPKRSKTAHSASPSANFLDLGARRAKTAKSNRKAAAVGLDKSTKKKKTHTGSGILLAQAIRLKYVKGFTQAVRTPCRLQDLE